MAQGFRAAEAFVEITADLDDRRILAAARTAAEGVDRELTLGIKRTGESISTELAASGEQAGMGLVRSTERAVQRDGRGRFVRAGQRIGEDTTSGIEDRVRRRGFMSFLSLIPAAAKAGVSAGESMAESLGKGFGPATPYLAAAVGAAVVGIGPWAGALLGAGMVAGLGTVAMGAGIALALRDPVIKQAAASTGAAIMTTLEGAATPFKSSLLSAFAAGEAAVKRWEPQLRQIMSVASTFIAPLVDGITGMVDEMLPGFVKGIEAARPVIDAISQGLTDTGGVLGEVFGMLSDDGPAMAAALAGAFFLINDSILFIGKSVNVLTETFGWMLDAFGWVMDKAGFLDPIETGISRMSVAAADGGIKLTGLAGAIGAGAAAGAVTAGTLGLLSDRQAILNGSMAAGIEKAGGLSAAFKLLNGGALSAREAESAYQAALDGLTASIAANGKGLNKQKTDFDMNTAAGRANDQAMRTLIGTVDAKAQAVYDETLATKGAGAAQAAATGVYEAGRQQLIKNLTKILGNKDAAVKMADSIMKIPKSWSTDVKVNDQATAKVGAIKRTIASINGRTVVIDVKYETHGRVPGEHIIGQGTQTKAEGGPVEGGSGWRDDVPLLAMGGEWVIRKGAVRALTRAFGTRIMTALNNYDRSATATSSRRGTPPVRWTQPDRDTGSDPVGPMGGIDRRSSPAPVFNFHPGSIVLDASRMRSITELIDMITGVSTTARTYVAGGAHA